MLLSLRLSLLLSLLHGRADEGGGMQAEVKQLELEYGQRKHAGVAVLLNLEP